MRESSKHVQGSSKHVRGSSKQMRGSSKQMRGSSKHVRDSSEQTFVASAQELIASEPTSVRSARTSIGSAQSAIGSIQARGPHFAVKLPCLGKSHAASTKISQNYLARLSRLGTLLILHAPGYLIRSRVLLRQRLLSQPAVVRSEHNVNQTFRDAEF